MPFFSIRNTNIKLFVNNSLQDIIIFDNVQLASYSIKNDNIIIMYDNINITVEKQTTHTQCSVNIYINNKFMFSSSKQID